MPKPTTAMRLRRRRTKVGNPKDGGPLVAKTLSFYKSTIKQNMEVAINNRHSIQNTPRGHTRKFEVRNLEKICTGLPPALGIYRLPETHTKIALKKKTLRDSA